MANNRKIKQQTKRRIARVRKALKAVGVLPRVSVFRSLRGIYAQLIDDVQHVTLASSSSLFFKETVGDKKSIAHFVGLDLAKKAKENGVEAVVFDRGRFLYHGRVRALADGLREGGLKV